MPAAYAHLYFGNRAEKLLPSEFALAVNNYRDLYNIGLHGPDIFFYYKPFKSCYINRFGNEMHYISAKEFFHPVREIYLESKNKDATLSYALGFLCHYALDSMCHSYIENKIKVSEIGHIELENEFDKYLLAKDGKEIKKTDLTAHIIPSKFNSEIIAEFFENINSQEVKKSLSSMKLCTSLLNSSGIKRKLVNMILSATGNKEMKSYMVPVNVLEKSKDSSLRLEKLLLKALEKFSSLLNDFTVFLNGGEYPKSMEKTFGPENGWEEIPILSLEEEKSYEV